MNRSVAVVPIHCGGSSSAGSPGSMYGSRRQVFPGDTDRAVRPCLTQPFQFGQQPSVDHLLERALGKVIIE